MTVGSLKVTDLRRDAQLLESSDPPQDNPSVWPSEAKLAGRAIWFASPKRPTSRRTFRVDATEAALTRVGERRGRLGGGRDLAARLDLQRPGANPRGGSSLIGVGIFIVWMLVLSPGLWRSRSTSTSRSP